jgi:hypothetical protein
MNHCKCTHLFYVGYYDGQSPDPVRYTVNMMLRDAEAERDRHQATLDDLGFDDCGHFSVVEA